MIDLTDILTVKEAAKWLGVESATVYLAISEKRLASSKLLGRIVVSKSAIIEYNRKRLATSRRKAA